MNVIKVFELLRLVKYRVKSVVVLIYYKLVKVY